MQSKTFGSEKLSSVYPLATSRSQFAYTTGPRLVREAPLFEKRSSTDGAEIPTMSGIQGREKKK